MVSVSMSLFLFIYFEIGFFFLTSCLPSSRVCSCLKSQTLSPVQTSTRPRVGTPRCCLGWKSASRVSSPLGQIVKPSPSAEQLEAAPAEDIPGGHVPAEHVPEEAEDVAESLPTTASQSGELESVASAGSVALPRSTDSAEELAKLRPRIDARLCPSPG